MVFNRWCEKPSTKECGKRLGACLDQQLNNYHIQNLAVAPGISDHDMVTFDINLQLENEKVTQTENLPQEESLIIDELKDDVMSFLDFFMSNLTET